MVRVWRKHNQFITDVHMQRGGVRELVSGCRDGEVKLWDLRWKDEVRTIRAVDTPGTGAAAARGAALRGLTVHEHAPVFAAGTSTHSLNLFNMNGTPLNVLNPTIPSPYTVTHLLQSHRHTPMASAAFHPHRMVLAGGAVGSGWINVWRCRGVEGVEEKI